MSVIERYECSNGHPFPDSYPVECKVEGCGASVLSVPLADAIQAHQQLQGAVERAAKAELALRQIAELLGDGDDPTELVRVAADVALALHPWRGAVGR